MIRDNYLDVNKLVGNKKSLNCFASLNNTAAFCVSSEVPYAMLLKGCRDLTSIWQPICLPMSWWKLAPKKG